MSRSFRALVVTQDENKQANAAVSTLTENDLPAGDCVVRVAWSSLNYKDALGATGHPGVVRRFPHVPGIDAAGTIESSTSDKFRPGDRIVITGFELGAPAWGGYSELIRVPAGWIVPLPPDLTLRESMIFGTAGFTAAQSVEALLMRGVQPGSGEVLVTGATGGVGSLAVAMLARLGFQVVAATGKPQSEGYLRELGAARIVGRDEVLDTSNRPLLSARWAGAVDTVGGNLLASVLRGVKTHGVVTCCGLVGGTDLNTSVYPFILRGIDLVGIDSATWPIERRPELWARMAGPWRPANLERLVAGEVTLEGLAPEIAKILGGGQQGRVLVRLSGE
ncbi:MAG: YhdH/YhfP family quinone oxidoreductase [Pirellulales bacterium]|nr:YhdH/YhfP family quinone oxidoreductase [Pirellulales bacterium]